MLPITENELECIIKEFKGKISAGYYEILQFVVKQCAKFVKGPLAQIYSISINSGTFPEKLKVAKVKAFYKNEIFTVYKIIDQYQFYLFFFLKYWKS